MRPIHLLTLLGLVPALLHAQVLVNWSFDTNATGTILSSNVASVANATVSGAGISGSRQASGTITNLPAGGGTGTGLSYIAPYEAGTANSTDPTPPFDAQFFGANGFSTAPSASAYISFQFTLASTISPLNLQGISFNLANSGTSGPRGVEVTYRVGTTGSFTSLGTTATPNNVANNYGLFTYNLTTPAALAANDVVEFRLLGYADSTGSNIRLDNVSITAIPEPSTYALLACGLASLVWLRRRNR